MQSLLDRLGALRARFAAASPMVRLGVLALAGALVAGAVLLYARSTDPSYEVLFSGLAAEDASGVLEQLRELRVPYRLDDEGTTILVPHDSVHETRLTLASSGLPSGGGVGFELFDRQRFGESEFAEQVQFRRALEGELARTIRHVAGVESARVHLVLPQRSLFATDESSASASVALQLRPGVRLSEDQVRGIVHLVAGSVRDLDPSSVTIIDGSGRRLAGGGSDDEIAGTAEETRARIEDAREREVQELLDQTLGVGQAVVDISADVTFAREERLEERYDPQQTATRSFEIHDEGVGAAETGVQGIPGAVSALPGGPSAEPLTGGGGGAHTRTEIRNFEVTKIVRRAVEPVGRIVRLQAAVVVDGRWEGEGGARHFVPRPAEELERIRAIVASAAGIQAERGDELTVQCVPLPERVVDPAALEEPDARAPWWLTYALAAAAGLGVFVVLARALRRRPRSAGEAAIGPGQTPALGLLGQGQDLPVLSGESAPAPDEIRKLVVEVVRAEPQVAARVVRAWLEEGRS